jgi:hypothetical protein
MADIVAVKNKAFLPEFEQLMIDDIRDRALAAGAQTGKPNDTPFVSIGGFPLMTWDGKLVPVDFNVIGACMVEIGHFSKSLSDCCNVHCVKFNDFPQVPLNLLSAYCLCFLFSSAALSRE